MSMSASESAYRGWKPRHGVYLLPAEPEPFVGGAAQRRAARLKPLVDELPPERKAPLWQRLLIAAIVWLDEATCRPVGARSAPFAPRPQSAARLDAQALRRAGWGARS